MFAVWMPFRGWTEVLDDRDGSGVGIATQRWSSRAPSTSSPRSKSRVSARRPGVPRKA